MNSTKFDLSIKIAKMGLPISSANAIHYLQHRIQKQIIWKLSQTKFYKFTAWYTGISITKDTEQLDVHILYDLQQKISKKSGSTVNQLTYDDFLSQLIEYKLFCSHYIVIFIILK